MNMVRILYFYQIFKPMLTFCFWHLFLGKRSLDKNSPDYVPSVFSFSKQQSEKSKKRKCDRYNRFVKRQKLSSSIDPQMEVPVTTLEEVNNEFGQTKVGGISMPVNYSYFSVDQAVQTESQTLEDEGLKKKHTLYQKIRSKQENINFYTGLTNEKLFKWVLSLVATDTIYKCSKIGEEEHLLLVLMKLKLGLLNTDLAFRFNITQSDFSRIFNQWVPALSNAMEFLIVWPERDTLRNHLPKCFHRYKNCVAIIDCTEIFIERPFNLQARAQTWSNYKNTNTIKYLLAITPAGAVSFLSRGWGGRVSEKEITIKSGFLDVLQHGDLILADRGFTISEELATYGATLKVPNFTKGKSQMSGKEVGASRKISNVRIHVERVIGRLRKFRILQSTLPITQVKFLDHVMIIISALVNINNSVISK